MLGIRLESDLRLSFEQLGIKFQSLLDESRYQFEELCKKAIDNFDFEEVFEIHIHRCIRDGLSKAFSEIDLSEKFKVEIWNEIEKRLKNEKTILNN